MQDYEARRGVHPACFGVVQAAIAEAAVQPSPYARVTDIVRACENQLGMQLDVAVSPSEARAVLAGRLRKSIAGNPGKYTFSRLSEAIDQLRHRGETIASPQALLAVVERIAKRDPSSASERSRRRAGALSYERALDDEHSSAWIERLSKDRGARLDNTLAEWMRSRFGSPDAS